MSNEGLPSNKPDQKEVEKLKTLEQIRIPRLVLKEPVTIQGADIFGRPTQVTLKPTDIPGWFWQIDGKDVPLQMKMLQSSPLHYLSLKSGKNELCVVEHLLPLRFAGIDGISIVAKTKWLPFDGSGMLFWKAIEKKLRYDGSLSPMEQAVKSGHSKIEKNGLHRIIRIDNSDPTKATLVVSSNIDYKKFGGAHLEVREFPLAPPDEMIDLLASKTLGKPAWSEYLLKIASTFGWPHYEKIMWPKKDDAPERILREIALHRMLDFLGAMAVIPQPGEYLLGDLFSDCGNHASDVELIRSIEKLFPSKDTDNDKGVQA